MASTGTALFLSLQARTEQLEKDLAKAKGHVRDFTRGVSKDAEGAAGFMEKIGLSGETAKNAFKNLAGGILLASGQVGGMGEKAQMLTQTFGAFLTGGPIAGGIVGLTSLFKIMSADTDATGNAAKRAAEQYKTLIEGIQKAGKQASEELRRLDLQNKSLELKLRGVDISAEDIGRRETLDLLHAEARADIDKANALRERIRLQREYITLGGSGTLSAEVVARRVDLDRRIQELNARGGLSGDANAGAAQAEINRLVAANAERLKTIELVDRVVTSTERRARLEADIADKTKETKAEVVGVSEAIDDGAEAAKRLDEWLKEWALGAKDTRDYMLDLFREMDRQAEAQQKIDDRVQGIVDGYGQELALAKAVTDEERDRLLVLAEVKRAMDAGADWIQGEAIFDAGMAAAAAKRALSAKSVVVKAEKAGRDIGEHITKGIGEAVQTELPRTLDPIFEQLGQTAFSGLGDALFDAITTGGKNASEIFQQTINSMLRQVINSILNSGLQMLLASIGGGGGGGGGGVLSSAMSFIPGLGGGDAVTGGAGLAGLADT